MCLHPKEWHHPSALVVFSSKARTVSADFLAKKLLNQVQGGDPSSQLPLYPLPPLPFLPP
eukprot:CAMPEP_0113546590 /NCGR_PEP_ID=MMETSP0015_2-20120614/11887_1 /TAXON_ID=2838 /ORGANISM="Odontella" /LENGTH=59 /DNA_ID=CAMNT_0000447055 /DNA_START=91 /DNA_END=266 /DNA_ORIENTATION=- /assembly_acc=CAM_ASM_000160